MFKLTVVISAFLLVGCLDAAPRTRRPRLDGRIVGGTNVNISEVPYQASLEYNGFHMCGAFIIDETYVLTAAHCVDGFAVNELTVRAGTSLRESGGSIYKVEKTFLHPKFDYFTMDCDMALIVVVEPFNYSDNVFPIALAESEPAPGTMALVSGWGTTSSGGDLPSQLQKLNVPIVDHDQCNDAYADYGGITKHMICAGVPEGGKDSCQGDSGGPLVVGGQLVGIVSWGLGCGVPGYPGVYTSYPSLLPGFRNIIHNHPRTNKL